MKKPFYAPLLALTMTAMAVPATGNEIDSPGSIRGKVTDAEHQALPGAAVLIESLHTLVTSDQNGNYSFSNLKPGTYKVKISYVGYEPKVITVKYDGHALLQTWNSPQPARWERPLSRARSLGNVKPCKCRRKRWA